MHESSDSFSRTKFSEVNNISEKIRESDRMMLAIDRNISVDIASVWERNTIISTSTQKKFLTQISYDVMRYEKWHVRLKIIRFIFEEKK